MVWRDLLHIYFIQVTKYWQMLPKSSLQLLKQYKYFSSFTQGKASQHNSERRRNFTRSILLSPVSQHTCNQFTPTTVTQTSSWAVARRQHTPQEESLLKLILLEISSKTYPETCLLTDLRSNKLPRVTTPKKYEELSCVYMIPMKTGKNTTEILCRFVWKYWSNHLESLFSFPVGRGCSFISDCSDSKWSYRNYTISSTVWPMA